MSYLVYEVLPLTQMKEYARAKTNRKFISSNVCKVVQVEEQTVDSFHP
jgi:hypothetical protein